MRIASFALLLTGAIASFDAAALDLMQVYQEALANDPVYASARYTATAGQEQAVQGRAGLLPTLSASGSATRIDGESESLGIVRPRDSRNNSYSISLNQPLFRWANWQAYQQGKLTTAATEARFALVQQELMVRVSQAYFDVLASQDALGSVQAQKTAITEQLASAKRNFEVGTATITDTHEAQARYDLAISQELAAEADLEVKRAALGQIIGKSAGELAVVRPGVQLTTPQPAQLDPWLDSAQTRNYAVIEQEFNREIAQREISRTRAGHLPTVDMVASRNHSNQRGSTVTISSATISDSTSYGLQWNIPIFSGFSVTSQVREAIALADKARADLENTRRTAAQDARTSYLGVTSGLAQVKALEAAEVSSQSALDSNRLGYQVGVRINIDVLNAQQQLFLTRRDLSKARYDTLVNGLKLKFAAGSLKEEDLAEVNGLLAPAGVVYTPPAAAKNGKAQAQASAAPAAKAVGKPVDAVAAAASTTAPTAATPAPADAAQAASQNSEEQKRVLAGVTDWAKSWSSRDAAGYLAHYSAAFVPENGLARADWEAQRRANIENKRRIRVKIDAPQVKIDGDKASVSFWQHYSSDRLKESAAKTLEFARENDSWKIVRERGV